MMLGMTDLPSLDLDVTVTIPATVVAALADFPSNDELDAASTALASWIDDETSGPEEMPDSLRETYTTLQARMAAGRNAAMFVAKLASEADQQTSAEYLAEVAEEYSQVIEVVAGYKAKMAEAGFDSEHAEVAAMQVHSVIMQNLATAAS